MEDCLEDIEQVIWFSGINESETKFISVNFQESVPLQGDGEKLFCSGNPPPPSYTLAVNV